MLRSLIALIAALFCIAEFQTPAQHRTLVVRQLDHLLVNSDDPGSLCALFTGTLQLPAAWPVSENQGYVTGGVSIGNMNLEVFRYPNQRTPARKSREAYYSGLAFEPYPLDDALRELKLRGIPHDAPQPYLSTLPDGSRGVAWTTVAMPAYSRPRMSVFLYEYSPVFLKVQVRRRQLANRLTLNNGGPLGIRSAAKILIATPKLKKDAEVWAQLLGKQSEPGSWRLGSGPGIRLVQRGEDGIQELVLNIESLDRALAFLKKSRLLGPVSAGSVLLNPSQTQGLRIRLWQEAAKK